MKKFLLSFLTLLAFAGSGTAQNLPSYVPANGLVGWWPFNGNANDESGNGNNGTVNGATLTADRFGINNKAYTLSQAADHIQTTMDGQLEQSSRSISLWFNFSTQANNCLFTYGKGDFCGGAFSLFVNPNNFPAIDICCANAIYPIVVQPNSWHHLVVTYESTFGNTASSVKFFLDGSFLSISPTLYEPNQTLNTVVQTRIRFGGELPNNFQGKLDDIAIYNRALSQQEITALYQGANTNANCPTFPASLAQGLVGYWPFCGNALDESGNGNHGTVNGATLTTDRFGNQGSAYEFDGVDDLMEVPNHSSLNFGTNQNITLSAWINKIDTGYYSILTKGEPGVHVVYQLMSPPKQVCAELGDFSNNVTCPDILSPTNLLIGNWQQVVLTLNRQEQKGRLYLNGDLVDEYVNTFLQNVDISSSANLKFGVERAGMLFFKGSLDDIAIWNRALSQNEIIQLYNQGVCQTSITVTDTLLIHTGITSYNPVAYQNTLKVWPNPGNQDITLDAGNLSLMQGWKIKISNSLGQEVYPATLINQQQQVLDMSTWGGNGLYLLHLINPQGHITEVKKIVLAP